MVMVCKSPHSVGDHLPQLVIRCFLQHHVSIKICANHKLIKAVVKMFQNGGCCHCAPNLFVVPIKPFESFDQSRM